MIVRSVDDDDETISCRTKCNYRLGVSSGGGGGDDASSGRQAGR